MILVVQDNFGQSYEGKVMALKISLNPRAGIVIIQ